MSQLREALSAAAIELPESQIAALQQYCEVLWDLNRQLNLTRHTTFPLVVNRDLVDTLHLEKLCREGEKILDIGSGGGVPGILLAILRPDLDIHLCESIQKKAQALHRILDRLGLACQVYAQRAEVVLEDERFDTVTARGVGSLTKLFQWLAPHWAHARRLLAIKGPKWREERLAAEKERLMKHLVLTIADRYPVPGEGWESFILEIRRVG